MELYSTCASPQVGVLSSDFVKAPRSSSFLGGGAYGAMEIP